MTWLLNVLYVLAIVLYAPWLIAGAIRHGKYRSGYAAKFLGLVPRRTDERPCVWFHAVSVGEVNVLAPLLQQWQRERSDWNWFVSTTTRTGFELAQKKYGAERVFYCPLDFSWAVGRAMKRIRPDVLVLAELELWPNLIRAAQRQGARVAVINGRLSEASWRGYRRFRFLLRKTFARLDLVAAQNETYAERFRDLGTPGDRVHVTGNLKFDGARTDRSDPRISELAALVGITPADVVFLAGSTQAPEEAMCLDAFRELVDRYPNLRLIVVPRHTTRADELSRWLDDQQIPWVRRSRLEKPAAQPAPRIVLVDTVGELGAWWGTARIAFVGGSFGTRGGQNMIEPAAYGAAVSFGPNTRNFKDVVELFLERRAAVVVHDQRELTAFVRTCLEDPEEAAEMGGRARDLVLSQRGAAQRTVRCLERLLAPTAPSGSAIPPRHMRRSAAPRSTRPTRS